MKAVTKNSTMRRHCILCSLLALCCWCSATLAQDSLVDLAHSATKPLGLTPVALMTDDQLYFAAEQVRSQRMPKVQRLFNHLWLNQSRQQTELDEPPVGQVLRAAWAQIRPRAGWLKLPFQSANVSTAALRESPGMKLEFADDRVSLNIGMAFH